MTKVVIGVKLWAITIAIEYGVIFGTHNDAGIGTSALLVKLLLDL